MDALDLSTSIREAKEEIQKKYDNGFISEDERNYQIEHLLGY